MPYSVPRRGSRHSIRLDRRSSVESHGSHKQGLVIPSSPSRHLSSLPVNVVIQRASTSPVKGHENFTELETTPMRKRRAIKLMPTTSEIPTPPTSFTDEGVKKRALDMYQKEITPTPTPTPTPSTGKRDRESTSTHSDAPSSASKRRAIQERKIDRSICARSSRLDQSLWTRQMSPQTELSLLQNQSAPFGFYNDMSDDDDDEAYTRDRCILLPTKRTRDMSRSRLLSDTTRTPTRRQNEHTFQGVSESQHDQDHPACEETDMIGTAGETDNFDQQDMLLHQPVLEPLQEAEPTDHALNDEVPLETAFIDERDQEIVVEEMQRPSEQWRRPTTPMTPAFDFDAATPHKSPFTPRVAAGMDLPMESTPLALLRKKTPNSKRKSLPNPDQERKVRASLAALNSPHKAQRLPVEIEQERLRMRQSSEIPASSPLSRLRNEVTRSASPSPLRQVRERELSAILAEEGEDNEQDSDLEDFSHFTLEKTLIKDDVPLLADNKEAHAEARQSPTKRSREESEEILEDDFVYETVVVEDGRYSPALSSRHSSRARPEDDTVIAQEFRHDILDEEADEESEAELEQESASDEEDTDEGEDQEEQMQLGQDVKNGESPDAYYTKGTEGFESQPSTESSDEEEEEEEVIIQQEGDDMQIESASSAEDDESDAEASENDDTVGSAMSKQSGPTDQQSVGSSDGENDSIEEAESEGDIEEEASSISGEKDGLSEDDAYSEQGDLDIEEQDACDRERATTAVDDASFQGSIESHDDYQMASDEEEASNDSDAEQIVATVLREEYNIVRDESGRSDSEELEEADERLAGVNEMHFDKKDRQEQPEEEERVKLAYLNQVDLPLQINASPRIVRRPRKSIIASHHDAIESEDEQYIPKTSLHKPAVHDSPFEEDVEADITDDADDLEGESDASSNRSSSPILEGILYNPMKDMRIDQEEAQRRQQAMEDHQSRQDIHSREKTPESIQSKHLAESQRAQSSTGNKSALIRVPLGPFSTPSKVRSTIPGREQSVRDIQMEEEEANTTLFDYMRDRVDRLAATSTTVEITSLNPEVAARCAKILEENHHYVQYGSVFTAVEEDLAGLSIHRASGSNKTLFDESSHLQSSKKTSKSLVRRGDGTPELSQRSRLLNAYTASPNLASSKTPKLPGHLTMSNDSMHTPSSLSEDQSITHHPIGSANMTGIMEKFTTDHWKSLERYIGRLVRSIARKNCTNDDSSKDQASWDATLQLDPESITDQFLLLFGILPSNAGEGDWSRRKLIARTEVLITKVQKVLVVQYPDIKGSDDLLSPEMTIPHDTVNDSTLAETKSRIPFEMVTQSTPTAGARQRSVREFSKEVSVLDDSTLPPSAIYPPLPSPAIPKPSQVVISKAPRAPSPPNIDRSLHDDRLSERADDPSTVIAALASKSLEFVRAGIAWSKGATQSASQLKEARPVKVPTTPSRTTEAKIDAPRKSHASASHLFHASTITRSNQSMSRVQDDKGLGQFARTGSSGYVEQTALTGISPNSHGEAERLRQHMRGTREARVGTPRRNRLKAIDKGNVSISQSRLR